MSYIEQSLGPGERLMAHARMAWLFTALAWLALLVGAAVGGAVIKYYEDSQLTRWTAGLALACGIAMFFVIKVPVWTTEIGVTNQRLIIKRGWLERTTEELQLWSIEEVDVSQGPLDRLFGFVHLVVYGTGEEDMQLPLIGHGLDFRKALQQAIGDARPGKPAN